MDPRERRTPLAAACAAALLLLPGLALGLHPSGCKAVVGALRVLDGEVPYRDFWSMYAPGQFYAVAGLFAVFGRELWVQGLAAILVHALSVGLLAALVLRLGAPRGAAWLVALAYACSAFQLAPELTSYPPALAASLGALLLVLQHLRGGGLRPLALAGALLGAAAWFKHDVAAYFALGCALGLALAWLAAGPRREPWTLPARAVAVLLGASAAAVLPVVLLLAWSAGADAWRDLVAFPAGDFRVVRGEGYPPPWPRLGPLRAWLERPADLPRARELGDALTYWILCTFPQVAFLGGAAFVALRGRTLEAWRLGIACVALAGLPFFWAAAHVQKNTHLTSMALLSMVAACAALGAAPRGLRAWRGAAAALLAVVACGLALRGAPEAWLALRTLRRPAALELDGLAGVHVTPREAWQYAEIARAVREHVPPGEPVHVGLARHDAVVVGNTTFYVLCARPPATRYHELHPGVTDREDVQREMAADLERAGVRAVVLWRFGWPRELLDRIVARRTAQLPDLGATFLDRWIEERYAPILERGEYALLWRRDLPPPPLGEAGGEVAR